MEHNQWVWGRQGSFWDPVPRRLRPLLLLLIVQVLHITLYTVKANFHIFQICYFILILAFFKKTKKRTHSLEIDTPISSIFHPVTTWPCSSLYPKSNNSYHQPPLTMCTQGEDGWGAVLKKSVTYPPGRWGSLEPEQLGEAADGQDILEQREVSFCVANITIVSPGYFGKNK